VKTPNLACNKDSETAAGESTVCEEKDKGDKDFIYYLIHPRGKGGTEKLGLHKGASQKKNIQLYTHKWLPKLQKKPTKIYSKHSHSYTKNKLDWRISKVTRKVKWRI